MNLYRIGRTLILLLFVQLNVQAQQYLSFESVTLKALTHGIGSVSVIDKRADTNATLGSIQVNEKKGLESLLAKQGIATEIKKYYQRLSDSSKNKSKQGLVILLYDFLVQEKPTEFSDETGSFRYCAHYFLSDSNEEYHLLGMIDTTVFIEAFDVTKIILRSASLVLRNQYEQLYRYPSVVANVFSYDEVLQHDRFDRKYFLAYHQDTLENAAYATWQDFLALHKMENKTVTKKNHTLHILAPNRKGKIRNEDPLKAKVLVCEGKAYYQTGGIFHELQKREHDFYLITEISSRKSNVPTADVIAAGVMFGVIGVIATTGARYTKPETYECRINPFSGQVIPIRKISKKELRKSMKEHKSNESIY